MKELIWLLIFFIVGCSSSIPKYKHNQKVYFRFTGVQLFVSEECSGIGVLNNIVNTHRYLIQDAKCEHFFPVEEENILGIVK